ncbi:hypothetical protein CARUB_v10010950mg [Capsella rubella]|uniref:Uncharacterized protein n=2 Tax=Capsella rubella TaxID=81985 RepID=R0I8R4_9BRAS|nr:hypothetical protein CARUB_v10010950mg [Capsella rubella]
MSCKGEIVVGVEEGLFLLPSNLFNELFLDCIGPFPQSNRGDSYQYRKPRMWDTLNQYGSMDDRSRKCAGASQVKPRGTGVFLPERPVSNSEEKRLTKKPCPLTSSHSRQVFLPKEWAY